MKKLLVTTLLAAAVTGGQAQVKHQSHGYPIDPVPFTSVKVTDSFWGQRLKASREVTIPLAFSKCEETGRYRNFINAAHPSDTIKVGGLAFDDTDVYKTIEGASYLLQTYPDKKLAKYIDSVLVIVAAAQEPDGYLYTSRTMNPKHPHEWAGSKRWEKVEELSHEFYNLGLGDPFPVSAEHGHGSGDMLDAVYDALPPESELEEQDDAIRVAIIGKPNVGKSSLVNRIAGEQRVIVSNVAGTTRDATDTTVENEEGKFVLIDTAGIRRKSKVTEKIEQYSVLRAYMAVDRADVCLIVIDATEGFTEQDSKVAGYAHEQGKASIVVVNKWDLVEKDGKTMQNFEEELRGHFSFMSYVPFLFLSAKTGQRVSKLFGMIKDVYQQNSIRVTTGTLNDILAYATTRVQPPSDKGRRLKIYYMTQPSTNPPTFVVFVNRADLFHFSYQRYLENQIRASFGLTGTPVRFVVRERNRDDQS